MNTYIEEARASGLIEEIKRYAKENQRLSIALIQREFSLGFPRARMIYDYLKEEGFLNEEGELAISTPLKIYLLDRNPLIAFALKDAFSSIQRVEVVRDDFAHFMDTHKDLACIVSPGNAFGYMDGGYDAAITDYFGKAAQEAVQDYIARHLFGEQPVATSILVDIPGTDKKLIHTPTMRLPSPIKDRIVVYQAMRTTLMCALQAKVPSIVIPAFGGATGKVNPQVLAKCMKAGYDQVRSFCDKTGKYLL